MPPRSQNSERYAPTYATIDTFAGGLAVDKPAFLTNFMTMNQMEERIDQMLKEMPDSNAVRWQIGFYLAQTNPTLSATMRERLQRLALEYRHNSG